MTLIKSISGIRGTIGGAPGNALTPVDIVKFIQLTCHLVPDIHANGCAKRLNCFCLLCN